MFNTKNRNKILVGIIFWLITFLLISFISKSFTNQKELDYNANVVMNLKKLGDWDKNTSISTNSAINNIDDVIYLRNSDISTQLREKPN